MTFPFRQPRLQLGPLRPDIPLAIDETHSLTKHVLAFVIMDGVRGTDLVSGQTQTIRSAVTDKIFGYGSDGAVGCKTNGTLNNFEIILRFAPISTWTLIEVSEIQSGNYFNGGGLRNSANATTRVQFSSGKWDSKDFGAFTFTDATTAEFGGTIPFATRSVRALTAEAGIPLKSFLNGEETATYSGGKSVGEMDELHVCQPASHVAGSVYETLILFDRVLTAAEHREIAANVYALTRPAIPMPVFTAAAAAGSEIKYWNGSAWTLKPLKYWDGASWQSATLKRWNGSSWVTE